MKPVESASFGFLSPLRLPFRHTGGTGRDESSSEDERPARAVSQGARRKGEFRRIIVEAEFAQLPLISLAAAREDSVGSRECKRPRE